MRRHALMKYVSVVLMFALVGCATYTPTTVGTPNASGPDVIKKVEKDVVLYVEEYATKEKSQKAFDAYLAKKGVLPLLVTVENEGETPYEVHSANIVVRDGDTDLKILTPEEASRKAKRSAVGRAVGWSLIVPIIAIPIAAASSATHTSKVNKRITQDFLAKAFQDGELRPQQKRSGFVFFELTNGRKNLDGLHLEIIAKNMATKEEMTIATVLPTASFAASKVASTSEDTEGETRMQ